MDHSHMSHGDMDMGGGDEMMCSMNVGHLYEVQSFRMGPDTISTDDLHLGL